MLQPSESQKPQSSPRTISYAPLSGSNSSLEQATIGRSLVIKGEVSGAEALYIDGRIEGKITLTDHRVTIGRNGAVIADINAREVVIMGKVNGNVICTDRLDIRSEGAVTGDVVTQRISVEDGAHLRGSVQVQASEQKNKQPQQQQAKPAEAPKPTVNEPPKAAAAIAGA